MIVLQKATENVIVVTLNEKKTLSSPYWLFVFQNEAEETTHNIVLSDISEYKTRYNKFLLTLPTDLNLTTEGDYYYSIYEQESAVNTDVDNTTSLVEYGKARLLRTGETEYYFNQ